MKLLAILFLFVVAGCKFPPPETPAGGVINCAQSVVQKCWPELVGPVNSCLAQEGGGWQSCLTDLIPGVGCGVPIVVNCLVHDQGGIAAKAAARNSEDVRSARVAKRTQEWETSRNLRFVQR